MSTGNLCGSKASISESVAGAERWRCGSGPSPLKSRRAGTAAQQPQADRADRRGRWARTPAGQRPSRPRPLADACPISNSLSARPCSPPHNPRLGKAGAGLLSVCLGECRSRALSRSFERSWPSRRKKKYESGGQWLCRKDPRTAPAPPRSARKKSRPGHWLAQSVTRRCGHPAGASR